MASAGVIPSPRIDPKDPSYWQVKSPEDIENYAHSKAMSSITPPDVNVGLTKRLPNNQGSQPLADTDNPPLKPWPGGYQGNISNAPVRPGYKLGDTTNPASTQIIPSPLQSASTGAKLKHTDHGYWKITPPANTSAVDVNKVQ
jgi:hypothetical protein